MDRVYEIELLIERGGEHLDWLRKWVFHLDNETVVGNSDTYALAESFDRPATRIRIFIGEFANALRDALNQITYAVAEQSSRKVGERVQFPIEESPDRFADKVATQLEGIPVEVVALFKRFQPYNGCECLSLLRALSNVHKHRHLVAVKKNVRNVAPQVRLTDETELSPEGIRVRKKEFYWPDNVDMKVNPPYTVALADGTPIIKSLETLLSGVERIFNEFKPLLKRD